MARRSKQPRRVSKRLPQKIHELVAAGGPNAVARNATAAAARQEMEFWLKLLERMKQEELDARGRMMCSRYIRNLRRKLGIRPWKRKFANRHVCVSGDFASAQNPLVKNEFERNQLA